MSSVVGTAENIGVDEQVKVNIEDIAVSSSKFIKCFDKEYNKIHAKVAQKLNSS